MKHGESKMKVLATILGALLLAVGGALVAHGIAVGPVCLDTTVEVFAGILESAIGN